MDGPPLPLAAWSDDSAETRVVVTEVSDSVTTSSRRAGGQARGDGPSDPFELDSGFMVFSSAEVERQYRLSRCAVWVKAGRAQLIIALAYVILFFIFALNGAFGDNEAQRERYKSKTWIQGIAAGLMIALIVFSWLPLYPRWIAANPSRRLFLFYGMTVSLLGMIVIPRGAVRDGTSSGASMLLILSTSVCMQLYMSAGVVVVVTILSLLVQFVFFSDGGASRAVEAFLPILVMGAYPMMALYQTDRQLRRRWLAQQRVDARRDSLAHENEQMESLLRLQLPLPVIAKLKDAEGRRAMAQRIQSASVCFADLEGWGDHAMSLDPAVAVSALNDLFVQFDDVVERLGIQKIKTIGPVYMVAGNVPDAMPDHTAVVARFGLLLLYTFSDARRAVLADAKRRSSSEGDAVDSAKKRESTDGGAEDSAAVRDALAAVFESLRLKIGLHVGEVVAGIVGDLKFCYDIYGDTVNTASRMCKFGEVDRIQCTAAARDALLGSPLAAHFVIESAGVKSFKGKGSLETFFVSESPLAHAAQSPSSAPTHAAPHAGDASFGDCASAPRPVTPVLHLVWRVRSDRGRTAGRLSDTPVCCAGCPGGCRCSASSQLGGHEQRPASHRNARGCALGRKRLQVDDRLE
eukprot:Opistho-1_new@104901